MAAFTLLRIGQIGTFEFGSKGNRRVWRRDLLNGRLERAKRLLRHHGGDISRQSAARRRFIHNYQPSRGLDTLEDSLLVKRRGRARIHQIAGDAFFGERVNGRGADVHHLPEGNDGCIIAFSRHGRLTEGNLVGLIRHLARRLIEQHVFEEEHRSSSRIAVISKPFAS